MKNIKHMREENVRNENWRREQLGAIARVVFISFFLLFLGFGIAAVILFFGFSNHISLVIGIIAIICGMGSLFTYLWIRSKRVY